MAVSHFLAKLPMMKSKTGLKKNNSPNSAVLTLKIRCVTRSDQAPSHGYLKKDIPLNDWNRYQLSKLR